VRRRGHANGNWVSRLFGRHRAAGSVRPEDSPRVSEGAERYAGSRNKTAVKVLKRGALRGFRLNGWQRIGIVLSVLWAIVGGTIGWKHAHDEADAAFRSCIDGVQSAAQLQACRDVHFQAIAMPRGISAAIIAFFPILVVWVLIFGVVGIVRWIRRGFQPSP
jgi:hypothetical protein